MNPSPPVTTEITVGLCTVKVRGKASRKGWTILLTTGAQEKHLGTRKMKGDAIQFAIDACEPGTIDTYTVRPSIA